MCLQVWNAQDPQAEVLVMVVRYTLLGLLNASKL